jgi:hypothetical protein
VSVATKQIASPLRWLRVAMTGMLFACLFAVESMAQDRALIIVIDSYADAGLGGLPPGLAKNNAAAIKKLLTKKLGYKPVNIKVLQNKQATKSAINSAITDWLSPEKKEAAAPSKLKGLDESGALKKKSKGKKRRAKKRRKKRLKSYRSYLYFAGFGLIQSEPGVDGLGQALVPYDATIASGSEKKKITGLITGGDLAEVIAKFIRRRTTLVIDAKNLENTANGQIRESPAVVQQELRPLIGAVKQPVKTSATVLKKTSSSPDPKPDWEKMTLWSAVSPGQKILVAGSEEKPVGLFTSDYVKAIVEAEADANANSIISNAEVLHFVSNMSSAYCLAYKKHCIAGQKPFLRPSRAYGRTAWVDRSKVSRRKERRLTLSRLTDFLGVPDESGISIKQDPPSPLKVGAGNIRYEVLSPSAGHLILLNLTDRGELFQLYPNQYAGQDKNGFAGKLEANTPLRVPEESYGVSFSATVPAKGHIIAVLAPGPVRFDASVNARTISSVSPREAIRVYLAELAAALNKSVRPDNVSAASPPGGWSIMTLPYEILP